MPFLDLLKQSFKDFNKHLVNVAILFFAYHLIILGLNVLISHFHTHEHIRYIYFIGKTLTFSLYSLLLSHLIFYFYFAKNHQDHLLMRSIIYPLEKCMWLGKHFLFIVFLGFGSNFTYLFKGVNPDIYRLLSNASTLTYYGNMNYFFLLTVFVVLIYIMATINKNIFVKNSSLSNFLFYGLDSLSNMSLTQSNMNYVEYKGDFLKIIMLGLIVSILASVILVFRVDFELFMLNMFFTYIVNMWIFVLIASTTVHLHTKK